MPGSRGDGRSPDRTDSWRRSSREVASRLRFGCSHEPGYNPWFPEVPRTVHTDDQCVHLADPSHREDWSTADVLKILKTLRVFSWSTIDSHSRSCCCFFASAR